MLQKNRQVDVINKNITKKILDTLDDMKKNEYDKYLDFYREFGRILKEGIPYDPSRKEKIADLLLFHSINKPSDSFITLGEYCDNMKNGQEEIFYITGISRKEAANSPYLEAFREKGFDVLIMLDEIDDFIMSSLGQYRGKKLKSVMKGDFKIDKDDKTIQKDAEKKFRSLLEMIKEQLKDHVKEVRVSSRLRDTACCLVSDEGALDPNMEKLLRAMGQEVPENKRILEINPSHPLFEAMNRLFEKEKKSAVLEEYIKLLYDQALLIEGSKPTDPATFAS
jgi:molecular chaperone HtpG